MKTAAIRVLSNSLVGRIAAGEVVERPASVVKELLENAIDAGASRVGVEIEGGPLSLIRVTDDGRGIAAEELPLAVQRHATSKIEDDEDLFRIASLGFRGEGLASIGAVSRLRLVSCVEGETGAEIRVEDSEIHPVIPAARSRGTTVEIRDLFFSTPARRKFLKGPRSEQRTIARLLQAYGLARPELHITWTLDGRRMLDWPPAADLHERLGQIVGSNRVERMIPILIEGAGLNLEGFLGAPEDSRARSEHQVFVLNGRWVQSPLLRQAVRAAYGDLIPPGRHPEAFLRLDLPADEVDVNVHPTKREVRLRREKELYPRLIARIRERVEGHFPALSLGTAPGFPAEPTPATPHQPSLDLFRPPVEPGSPGWVSDRSPDEIEPRVLPFPDMAESASGDAEHPPAMANLWQIHGTYIFARVPEGLLIIDQHAAHERVLYEEAMERFRGESPASQELLFPTVVELAPDEFPLLLEAHAALESLGFHLETFGGTSVLVHAIPAGVRAWRHGALLRDILDHFGDLSGELDVTERIARSVACHAAVKAGQILSLREMNELVDQLFATDKPQGDPHGRPVFLRMELSELHRRFGRSG